jgi:diacylglycerol kinase family enzyme
LLQTPAVKTLIVLNAGAGGRDCEEIRRQVEQACAGLGLAAEVRTVDAAQLRPTLEHAVSDSGIGTVVVGGGDGTLNTAANVLVDGGKPMGILPLGTLNHFARDLDIPPGIEDAIAVVAAGRTRSVDVGEVNGRVFLNNCSIGLYAEAVRQRERLRDLHGWDKWTAMARGAWEALRRFRRWHLTLRLPETARGLSTPQLVIANNKYETGLLALGHRAQLDCGCLWVYLTRHRARYAFVRLVVRALLGRMEDERDFEALSTPGLTVEERRPGRRIFLAIDGELERLDAPLRFASRPRALTVLAP